MLIVPLLTAAAAAACPANLANGLRPAPPGTQLVTVEASVPRTTYATLRTWARSGGCWRAVGGPYAARIGRNGLRRNRHEGDGTTPIGTFRVGRVMYGNLRNPGVRFRYRRIVCGDHWVDDVTSTLYNTFQHVPCGRRAPFRVSGPGLWEAPTAYAYFAVVEFNMHPIVPGRGSGIFLHAQTGSSTAGCISLRRPDLVRVLRWLSPRADARIAIGTSAQFRSGGSGTFDRSTGRILR